MLMLKKAIINPLTVIFYLLFEHVEITVSQANPTVETLILLRDYCYNKVLFLLCCVLL